MAAVELATGYVTLAVETRGINSQVAQAFRGAGGVATTAGRSMGQSMARSFNAARPNIDVLRAEFENAEKRIVAQAEVSARKQEAAKRKVEIAQAKLNETTTRYGAGSSQALTAADRLAVSEQKLTAETMAAQSAQNKLQTELNQSRTALDNATAASSNASSTYARGWKGVGQRLKGYLTKGVRSAGREAEQAAAKSGKEGGGRFSSAFKGAIAGLAAGVSIQAIGTQIVKSITNAGNLEQSIGAIDSVFKGSANQMHDWAKNAAVDVGLTQNEFNELGTLIGAQLKNGGTAMDELGPKTKGLIGLGADLSSMFGGTTKEAVEALSSALKGEMDPIEKYGITMNAAAIDAEGMRLGLEKTGKSWSTSAKQAIVMSLATQQSADAQGNFARESDTFAHKQQVMQAKFENLTTTIGGFFLPVLTKVFSYVADVAIPGISTFFGWLGKTEVVRVLGDTFKNLGSFVQTDVVPAFAAAGGWLKENSGLMSFLGTVIGTTAGALIVAKIAMGAWSTAVKIATGIQAAFNFVMNANPIMKVVALIGLLVGAIVWLYKNNETAKKIIDAAWQGIQTVVKFAWNNIIKPVFNAIVGFVKNTLAPIFNWLWKNIISPVFTGIWSVVKIYWALIETIFKGIVWTVKNVLAPIFTWLWKNIVQPVFAGLFGTISDVWNKKIKPVLEVFGGFLKATVGPALSKGVDTIKKIWEGIRKIAAAPINFVIDTVYNNGLRKALNLVRKVVGGDPLDPLPTIGGYAKGGKVKENWYLAGEEGPELIHRGSESNRVYTAAETAKAFSEMGSDSPLAEKAKQAATSRRGEKLPIGGWLGDIGKALAKPIDWVRGGLANAAEKLIGPLKDGVKNMIPGGTEFGKTTRSALDNAFAATIKWIRGKDEMPETAGGGSGGDSFLKVLGALGSFSRPRGTITSGFGSSRGAYPHAGIDFAQPIGSIVRAMFNGVVRKTGWNAVSGRSGKGEVIDHPNGYSSYYGHLSGWTTKAGDKVKAGQPIAYSGNTGKSTGPHLHAEIWKNGNPFNFMSWLHDDGGYLGTGKSVLENKTGHPEPVLTAPQWDTMFTLADSVRAGDSGGDNYYIESIIIPASDIAEFKDITEFFNTAKRTMRKGVIK